MKTLTLKFNAASLATTLANPNAPLGIQGNVSVYRVVSVPYDVPAAKVLALFNETIIPFPEKLPVPWTVHYAQLGEGRVIHQRVLVRADQIPEGATFSVPAYSGLGIRTCRVSWLSKVYSETLVNIDCGVGISLIQLVPDEVLEVVGGAA